jgi:hypothetical protein
MVDAGDADDLPSGRARVDVEHLEALMPPSR